MIVSRTQIKRAGSSVTLMAQSAMTLPADLRNIVAIAYSSPRAHSVALAAGNAL
jgi:hypothetical protein